VVRSGAVHRSARERRTGTASSYYSRGYPCFRLSTVSIGKFFMGMDISYP
jgi:hypothetical protein